MVSDHSKNTPYPEEKQEDHSHEEEKKDKNDDKKGTGAAGVIIAIVCVVLEAIVFILSVVGTPIDCFRGKTKVFDIRYCYSMWGYKRCGPHKANPGKLQYKGFPTSGIRSTMNAAAAFSIIAIFFSLMSLILTILLVCKCMPSFIAGVFSIIAFISTLIVWACQAGVYYRSYTTALGVKTKIKNNYHYAGSFGLFVTAWCLQTIEMVLVFFA